MMKGALIAGLAMSSKELPSMECFLPLENPEVRGSPSIGLRYGLEEVAEFHLKTILSTAIDRDQIFTIQGMSMGGMILSILASEYRNRLPVRSRFVVLVSSANLESNPALTEEMLRSWFSVRPGQQEDFRRILVPMFSKTFRSAFPDEVQKYIQYRTQQENGQSSDALVRQIKAIKAFDGRKYFPRIDPNEVTFIYGAEDEILGKDHADDLRALNPEAKHITLSSVGHMINIEQPDAFRRTDNVL